MINHYLKLLKGKNFWGILRGIKNVACHSFKKALLFCSPVIKSGVKIDKSISVVISLTSFPTRICTVHNCIKTILNQSYKPSIVVLWLAKEQFPKGEADLPQKLLRLKKYGLTIKWCSDIRSYKKIIPTLNLYPNSIIITTDDDVYYRRNWLKGLMKAYFQDPHSVYCYRAAKIHFDEGIVREDPKKGVLYSKPTFLHQQTGVGGVLYPCGCFFSDVTKEEIFMKLAPTNDDLWLWIMNILNGYRVTVLDDNDFELFYIKGSQSVSLTSINDHGEKLFYSQLSALLNYYPEVISILQNEQKEFILNNE